jgi:hypothetical protein
MNTISAPRLESAIRSTLVPLLRDDGFTGSGRTFRRVRDCWVQVVNVQGSRKGSSFAINLAIHPLAIPDLRDKSPDPKKITVELCEFRRRLSETKGDHWWSHDTTSESMVSAMTAAAEVYRKVGRPVLERVSGPTTPLITTTPSEFRSGSYDFAGFGSTKVRMALALSLIRKFTGRFEESKAFATYGLENIGSASFLRRDLEVLSRGE